MKKNSKNQPKQPNQSDNYNPKTEMQSRTIQLAEQRKKSKRQGEERDSTLARKAALSSDSEQVGSRPSNLYAAIGPERGVSSPSILCLQIVVNREVDEEEKRMEDFEMEGKLEVSLKDPTVFRNGRKVVEKHSASIIDWLRRRLILFLNAKNGKLFYTNKTFNFSFFFFENIAKYICIYI